MDPGDQQGRRGALQSDRSRRRPAAGIYCAADRRGARQGRQGGDDPRLRLHPDAAVFSRRLRPDRLRDGRQADRRLDDREDWRKSKRAGGRAGRDHADDPAQGRRPRLFQAELPGLQNEVHQHTRSRVGDEDPACCARRAAGRSVDQLRPAHLRFDGAIRSRPPFRRQIRRRKSSPTTARPSCSI